LLIAYQRIDLYICLSTNMKKIYLSLGTNQGSRLENLQTACIEMSNYAIKIKTSSPIYETAPWGKSDQPWFYNLILDIESTYGPEQLLEICLGIEGKLGRIRKIKWDQRIIDIDILYFGDLVIETKYLKIPHPEIQNRRFNLLPLVVLNPLLIHPILFKSQKELLAHCDDNLACHLTSKKLDHGLL
jgi:2-amino-4-hydroxy-6-hydroxymethyldihydropteridine diphosphokinase